MINLKNIYVDINGIVLNKETYYLVTFTKYYEISLFGHAIKEFKKIEEVPFVFKSLEIAKDFCKLKPTYKKCVIHKESTYGFFDTYYNTYKLLVNNKIDVYIIWNTTHLTYSHNKAEYNPYNPYPIIRGFVKRQSDIKLLTTYSDILYSTNGPKTLNMANKLSDIFNILENDKHHFKLLEQ